MRQLIINPEGWPCSLRECPPGHFLWEDTLCFKTEYCKDQNETEMEVYNGAGERFCYKGNGTEIVQPIVINWEET